jgi:glyoxylase-like metal-dependent hydrolase (beta-lactamase superfamily II)
VAAWPLDRTLLTGGDPRPAMAVGDVDAVPGCTDLYYLDTGMYDTATYGSVYLVDADRTAVVDTGIGTHRDRVFDAVDDYLDGHLDYVLPTHVHLDHAGGAGYLAARHPEATVLTHERGVRHLVDPARLVAGTKAAVGDQWEYYVEPEPVPEDRIEGLADGDVVDLGDRRLDVVAAPGHAPHQVVFHDDGDDVLFTADAAGIYLPAHDAVQQTTPPPQFDLEAALDDVRTIEGRDPATLAFGHFGPREFDPAVTELYRRTLIEWVQAVREARAELDDEAVVERFAADPAEAAVEAWGERKASAEERLNARGVIAYLDRTDEAGV